MGVRRLAREIALQGLYLNDSCGFSSQMALDTTLKDRDLPGNEKVRQSLLDFSRHLLDGVLMKKDSIDSVLKDTAEHWEIGRMAVVDRNILRIAAYEILYDPETPVSVVMDEAIELAKTYSTEDSGKFVNGILDKLKTRRLQKSKNDG